MEPVKTPDEIRAALRVELLKSLPANLHEAFDEMFDSIESERDELKSREEDWDYERDELEAALRAVRDWMADVLYENKPMRDPRGILRIVERALEP
jgi:hypothetical protein